MKNYKAKLITLALYSLYFIVMNTQARRWQLSLLT